MSKTLLTLVLILPLSSIFAQSPNTTNPHFIKVKPDQAQQSGPQLLRQLLAIKAEEHMAMLSSKQDKQGFSHEKFQHYYKGLKVDGSTYSIHSKNGKATHMTGNYEPVGAIGTNPELMENEALALAIASADTRDLPWTLVESQARPTSELVIVQQKTSDGALQSKLSWKFHIIGGRPFVNAYVYIDAKTGEVVRYNSVIKHLDATGSAATRYSGTQTIHTDLDQEMYRLRDYSRGNGVLTYDATTATRASSLGRPIEASDYTDNDNDWTLEEYDNVAKDNAGLDAHFAAEATYDFFMSNYGRDSYDGIGAAITSYVNTDIEAVYGYPASYNDNAFWTGYVMVYGKGNSLDPLTTVDITAHEIGHAFCTGTADLVYEKESGAMNEGLSDIWGACVEHYVNETYGLNKDIWNLGTETGQTFRSMSNPKAYGAPDTYGGTYWVDQDCSPSGSNDYCGVHTNSGVANHWFYILSEGKAGTNDLGNAYDVTGIGVDDAAAITWQTEAYYLTSTSDYEDFKDFSIQAAKDLFGEDSDQATAVANAWYAVGVGLGTCDLVAPVNLAASDLNEGGFTLSWDEVEGAVSYEVKLNNQITPEITVSTTDHSYVFSELISGLSYTCTVNASCTSGGAVQSDNFEVDLLLSKISTFPYVESFETADHHWFETGGLWELGTPSQASLSSASEGTQAWATDLDDNYPNNADARLISPVFDLSTLTIPTISFDLNYHIEEDYDGLQLAFRTDLDQDFQLVPKNSGIENWYNYDAIDALNDQPGWSGTSSGNYLRASANLDFLESANTVQFAFVFKSDNSINLEGVAIDNLEISGTPAFDLVLAAIITPDQIASSSDDYHSSILVQNRGFESLEGFTVHYYLNGGGPVIEEVVHTLAPFESMEYTSTASFTFPEGDHNLQITIELPEGQEDQGFTTNNTQTIMFTSLSPISTYPYVESFETADHHWFETGGLWELGTPSQASLSSASEGTQAWATDLDDNYPNNADARLISPVFDLSALILPVLSFDLNYEIDPGWDGLQLAYRTDLDQDFQLVPEASGIENWYNYDDIYAFNGEPGWSGSSIGNYLRASANLDFLESANTVQFAFVFKSDDVDNRPGVAIDYFKIFDRQPEINFTLDAKTYGDEPYELSATSTNVATPIIYESSDESILSIEGSTATINGAGEAAITASQEESEYYSAGSKSQTITIARKTLTTTVANEQRLYGADNLEFTITYDGFVNEEDVSVLDEVPVASTTADVFSDVGDYAIEPSGGSDNNYDYDYVNGSLGVTKRTLTVTADNQERLFGAANSDFTITYEGFVNGEDASVLDEAPEASTSADVSSDVGSYAIELSGGSDHNYEYDYVNGTLTITQLLSVVDNLANESVMIYPNPSNEGFFSLKSNDADIGQLQLVNQQGQVIKSYPYEQGAKYDLNGLKNGLYVVMMQSNDQSLAIGRLMINR